MALIDLFASTGYKAFIKRLAVMSLVVVATGVVLFLLHLQGAKMILLLGGLSLAAVGLLKLIELIVKRNNTN